MKRRFLAPEVIQTSQTDCGPAALTSLLSGLGIPVSYGRLREACQTGVDGTSVNVLEDLAVRLGLDAEQVMWPVDHLMLPSLDPFPAILVTKDPAGAPHFVVAWRRVGERIQLMDPGRGRRWVHLRTLKKLVFVHQMPFPAVAWREWAESKEYFLAVEDGFARIGARVERDRLLETARTDPSWRSYAALDAALRMTRSLVDEGAIERGAPAASVLVSLFDQARRDVDSGGAQRAARLRVPFRYWFAIPAASDSDGVERVLVTGVVLIRVRGLRAATGSLPPLSPELEAVVRESPAQPLRHLGKILRQEGVLAPTVLLVSLAAAAFGGAVEVLLLRVMLDVGRRLGIVEQRLAGLGLLGVLVLLLLVLDLSFANGAFRMGMRIETRLRVAFLTKIPRLHDRYFQSRPASDMAHRCHTIHPVRELPVLGGRVLRSVMDLVVVAAGLTWIDPRSWPLIALMIAASIAGPWLAQRFISERDLRLRSFDGALSRYYLDALQGLMPLRAHGAESALRREHMATATEWARAGFDRLRAWIVIDAIQQIAGSLLAVLLVVAYLAHSGEPAPMLLFVYWALQAPALGQEIARTALLYPSMRNRLLRLLEPLGALEHDDAPSGDGDALVAHASDAHIVFRDVSVRASGHTILKGVDLSIPKGSHVAIVGPSGAGKSTLVGLLLGWHRSASGEVYVDGEPLRGDLRKRVRAETAWVDPAVQIWNRTLLANLEYGSSPTGDGPMATVLEDADLLELVERLPHGLQTVLGEGGAFVAGGEGRRVRLGRAMRRAAARLVILDEAFRGLDRGRRHTLLACARKRWKEATLLCVTHDMSETRDFDRVILIEEGRVLEDGAPAELLAREGSRYAALLRAEEDVRRKLWDGGAWRRVTIRDGKLTEDRSPHGAKGATGTLGATRLAHEPIA